MVDSGPSPPMSPAVAMPHPFARGSPLFPHSGPRLPCPEEASMLSAPIGATIAFRFLLRLPRSGLRFRTRGAPVPLTELNHYFVRTTDLERAKRFYCDILGFEQMPRPEFPFPGYWLGVNGKICVHMAPHGVPNQELYYLGTTPKSATDNSGIVDHVAFL